MISQTKPQTCQELLKEFEKHPLNTFGEKLYFKGVGDRDVYNITAPFEDEGELVIAGRVEKRDSEQSEVLFFIEKDGYWQPKPGTRSFKLQDPFISKVHGQLIFGGVQTFPHPEDPNSLSYRTIFYKGENIANLVPFAKGPDGMKDIRLVELGDGNIGVFTRPQGKIGGRGKIGFTKIKRLEELNEAVIESAFILEDQFVEDEWGGANELHLLKNGLVGVLGHIACFDEEGNRNYYPMVFKLDPETLQYSPMKIIATRENFPPGDAKRPDLVNVIFSGGLIKKDNTRATLYVGVSDAEAHKIDIPNPFI